jgi:hypothetical protein
LEDIELASDDISYQLYRAALDYEAALSNLTGLTSMELHNVGFASQLLPYSKDTTAVPFSKLRYFRPRTSY